MFGSTIKRKIFALVALTGAWVSIGFAQSADSTPTGGSELLTSLSPVTNAMLLEPPAEDWLLWRQSYDSHGFSSLDQITSENAAELELAWKIPLAPGPNMATPLVHDGVMFLASTEDIVLALDARTGIELWRYAHIATTQLELGGGTLPAKVGLALSGNKVVVPSKDLHLLALDFRTGELIWDHALQTTAAGAGSYSLRAAPLVIGDMIVQGVTATNVSEGGFIVGLDVNTGNEIWRFHTIAKPGEAGGNTWNDIPLTEREGGSVWLPGSYVPELDLAYFGTAPTYHTAPLVHPVDIPGVSNDALYTNTTLALRPRTGELVWHYQHVANDQWDLDWTFERQIIELSVNDVSRKVLVTAGKMALYDALDAATGEYLFSMDMGLQTLVTAIDTETGNKTLHPYATPSAEQNNLICPFPIGGRNWPSAAVNPQSKMLFLPMNETCMMAGVTGDIGVLSSGARFSPAPVPGGDGKIGRLQAVNLETRELAWNFRESAPLTSAVMATAGGLVFSGALDESFRALDASTGEVLWQTDLGDIPASFPISYSVDNKQYIALVIGQATLHASTLLYLESSLPGQENSPLRSLSREGAALVVYALP